MYSVEPLLYGVDKTLLLLTFGDLFLPRCLEHTGSFPLYESVYDRPTAYLDTLLPYLSSESLAPGLLWLMEHLVE